MQPKEANVAKFRPIDYLSSSMTRSPIGSPVLFVFDNFETVSNPGDLFAWLDTYIRLPNKIVITTRHREFKADYPVDVPGMSDKEAAELMDATAFRLNIQNILTSGYRSEIFDESGGHPYIIKILLGEVAKARMLVKVERIVAGRDEVLDALFERTYAGLQPAAKRVFLVLCSWRSLVPEVALQAVMLRRNNERMDVEAAIEELISSSFVDRVAARDQAFYLIVPLVAAVFGKRKLQISPMKPAVDADVEFLQLIGATSASGLRNDLWPRVKGFFEGVASRLANGRLTIDAIEPSLEFMCRQYPPAWLTLAKLYEELGGSDSLERASECLRRYLERPQHTEEQRTAWEELERLYTMKDRAPGRGVGAVLLGGAGPPVS